MNAAEFAVYSRRTWRAPVFRFPAAYYDLLPENYITATGLKLLGDKSGNSGVNVLALNGVAGNYASALDSVPLSITGDIDLRAYVALNDWTSGAFQYLISKILTDGQGAYDFAINATGNLIFRYTADGSFAGLKTGTSTAAVAFADFALGGVRVTYVAATGQVLFYTSSDFVTWTQLGNAVAITAGNIFDGTDALRIGQTIATGTVSGLIYRAQIYNGIAGTLAFDANFSTFTKLAATGTESSANAATVTINTTGDTGARICGARDVVQMTGTKQPSLPGVGALFDGSDDFMKAAAWAMAQPVTVYFAGQQVTWTDTDKILDGSKTGESILGQSIGTPSLVLYALTGAACQISPALATNCVITSQFNGASSLARVNRAAGVTGNPGSAAMHGITLGARADGLQPSNILLLEVLVFNAAHDEIAQQRMARDEMRKNRIPMAA